MSHVVNPSFSIFRKDLKQYSFSTITDNDSKAFMWDQFMLDVLLSIPHSRSSADKEDIIAGAHLVNELDKDDPVLLSVKAIEEFQSKYTPDKAIYWYTKDSFVHRSLNKACRIVEGDALIRFHPIVKHLDKQLKQLHLEQQNNRRFRFPMTVYRTQEIRKGELEKLRQSQGSLISMNSFLSTSIDRQTACMFTLGVDKDSAVLFQIKINDVHNNPRLQRFANIYELSAMPDENEILFSMSCVFKVISIVQGDEHWIVDLELTDCQEDEQVQKLMNEVKSYLYQVSNKQLPLIVFKRLLTKTSSNYMRSLTELMTLFLNDITRLFVASFYQKEGRLKRLIDEEPILKSSHTNEPLIGHLIDLLIKFSNRNKEKSVIFNTDDQVSLLCFGGFLLLTGNVNKGIQYFEMLKSNTSINERLKDCINGMLRVLHLSIGCTDLAMNYKPLTLTTSELNSTSNLSSAWFIQMMSLQNEVLKTDKSESAMFEKQADNDISEKVRLFFLATNYFEQNQNIKALNCYEEALSIQSYFTKSTLQILNGSIYVQMSAVYQALNNMPKALRTLEKGLKLIQTLYPSNHIVFASFYPRYAFYLLHYERTNEAIEYLTKLLENPQITNDCNMLCNIYILLAIAYIQCQNLESAEQYCNKAFQYSSLLNIGWLRPTLLDKIEKIKQNTMDSSTAVHECLNMLKIVITGLCPNLDIPPNIIDEQTCTKERLITYGDYYRYVEDFSRAEIFYSKALEKMTEIDWKLIWNVFNKMQEMNSNDSNQYRDYFIEQLTKYDDSNRTHYEVIITLQIILYRFNFDANEFELAFDCLIYGVFLTIKILYHQMNTDENFISNICDYVFRNSEIAQACDLLTKLIQLYSNKFNIFIQSFLSTYSDLNKIIYHVQIDEFLEQSKVKYNDNNWSKLIIDFLQTLLQVFRQTLDESEKSTVLFSNYTNELMKTVESFFQNDEEIFYSNLEKVRLNLITFEYYQKFKEKLSNLFNELDEDDFH